MLIELLTSTFIKLFISLLFHVNFVSLFKKFIYYKAVQFFVANEQMCHLMVSDYRRWTHATPGA